MRARRRVCFCIALFVVVVLGPAASAQTGEPGGATPAPPSSDLVTAVLDLLCKLTGLPLVCPPPPAPQLPPPAGAAAPATTAPSPAVADPVPPARSNPAPSVTVPSPSPSPPTTSPATVLGASATTLATSRPLGSPSTEGAARSRVGPAPATPRETNKGLVLPKPEDLDLTPVAVVGAAAVSLLGLILLGFPAELFNKTLQNNYGRLARLLPWITPSRTEERPIGLQVAALVFSCAVAGVIGMFQKLHDWNFAAGARTALGIACGFLVTVAVYEVAGAAAGSRMGLARRSFRSYTGALPIVALFVGVSTLGHLQPAYVYGHLAGSRWDEDKAPPLRGRALQTTVASVALLLVALTCWGARAFVTSAVASDLLAGIVLVGLNRLAFSLIPVTFLDGHTVASYSRALWACLYVAVITTFILLVLLPTVRRSPGNVVGVSLVLFVLFAGLSVGLWAWFRRSHQRQLAIREALP